MPHLHYDHSKSLDLYLKEMGEYPLLDANKQQILDEQIVIGDKSARNELIVHNLRLVISIAKNYISRMGGTDAFLDLIEEGNIGLIRAAQTYNPKEQVKFSTWASKYINGAINRAISDNKSGIRPFRIAAHIVEHRSPYSNNDLEANVAQGVAFSISLDDLENENYNGNAKVTPNFTNLDANLVLDSQYPPNMLSDYLRKKYPKGKPVLDERGKRVLTYRYSLDGMGVRTREEIADIERVTPERIRQIENRSLDKLREYTSNLFSFEKVA